MRLAPESTYQHDWQGLTTLRLLLKGRSGPPHYLSSVDPRTVQRITELLKMHDLCISVLANLPIQERDVKFTAHRELLGIAQELDRASSYLSKGSQEILTLANRLAEPDCEADTKLA